MLTVYAIRVFLTPVYKFMNTPSAGCAHASMYAQFVHWFWGTRVGRFSYSRAFVANVWSSFWHEEDDRGVICIFSIFWRGLECMWVYVCVYAHAHKTLHVGYSDVSPGVGTKHLESPKNLNGLALSINVFECVYKLHMCIYMLSGGIWNMCTNYTCVCIWDLGISAFFFTTAAVFSFRKRNAQNVN